MSKSKIFIWVAISFSVGVLIASRFAIPRQGIYIFLAFCAAGFALSFLSNSKRTMLVVLFLFCIGVGALRVSVSMVPSQFQSLLADKQSLPGYIVEDVALKSNQQVITFRPDGFSQNIQITTTLVQNYFYGDRIVANGKLTEPKNYGDFDYQSYLKRFNIYAVMDYPQVLILKSNQLNPIKYFLLKIKEAFEKKVVLLFNEPQNSLLIGILIGGHASLPQSIVDDFNNTGTSHIIAVSGFNITIIVTALASLAFVLGRRLSFWVTVLTIFAFVIITGASASVVRAGIMGFLLLLSFNIGRQYSIAPSLFFAGLIMLIVNPKILFWDVGFQLSFAATLGIIYFLPVLSSLTEKIPELLGVKSLVLTTLSAIIATLPIILFSFGTLSLSAPIVNVLVLPIVPFAMLFGFLSVLPWVGAGFAFIANWLLLYILKTTNFFAHLPYSNLSFQISVWVLWVLILAVFALYFGLKYLIKRRPIVVELNQTL